ncbi:MAG: pyridoxal 5'-phosphate synthase lyase subunit PdxS, partial [Deltaproteobacteria bacterium]|nr:pyridoxal 5'-phosphate synthase lyase subunit PdxS [Deltaproteobacteria bacterium]
SGIFKSGNPERLALAIVEATANYQDPKILARCSQGLGVPMKGLDVHLLKEEERLQERGW